MKKNKIDTGSIIRIPLEHDLGFVLGKFINLTEINALIGYNEFMYVYNHVFKNQDINVNDIIGDDLLLGGIYVLNPYPAVKNNTWEIIGHLEPRPEELLIPDFRSFGPLTAFYEKDATFWYHVKSNSSNTRVIVDYQKVKHLEDFIYKAYGSIMTRLTMEVIRQRGEKIEDYYELKEHDELSSYYNTIYTTVYSEIPVKIRGRVIE